MTKYIVIGQWNVPGQYEFEPVESVEDLRQRIISLKIKRHPKAMKLSAIWGRKWIEYIGVMPDGREVSLGQPDFFTPKDEF